MKRNIKIVGAFTLAIVVLLVLPSVALAIANPTSGPTIIQVGIFRHCLETDDQLIVVQYYLNYTENPDETINQAFLSRYMNGATELANVKPYAYYDKGYDYGIFTMYLGASEAPVWDGDYAIRFEGNPTLEWPGDPPSVTSTTLNWYSTTTTQATELLLSAQIISIANSLSDYWSIALTSETAGGAVLSAYGEQYFVSSIPNLREMTPGIFSGTVTTPEFEETTHTQSYRDTLLNRWSGTNVENTFIMLAEWTHVPLTVLKALLWSIAVGLIAYFIALGVGDLRPALFLVLLAWPLGNLIGMLSLTVTIVGALFCILALGYALFYQKAQG